MGITNPVSSSARGYKAFSDIPSPLLVNIINPYLAKFINILKVIEAKFLIRPSNQVRQKQVAD